MRVLRSRLALGIGLAIVLAYETYALFIKTEGAPGYLPSGSRAFLTSEVVGGPPLALEFAMHADGLEAIVLYPHASYAPPEGTVRFTLIDQVYDGGTFARAVTLATSTARLADVVAAQPYRVRLPRIDRSAGRHLRLEVAVDGSRPQHGVRFEAGWPDNADARLLTGDREEWADLKFQTVAERTTIASSIARLRRAAPPMFNTNAFWIAFALAFNAALWFLLRDLVFPLPLPAADGEAQVGQTSSANRR